MANSIDSDRFASNGANGWRTGRGAERDPGLIGVASTRRAVSESLGRRESVRWPGRAAPFEVWTDVERVGLTDFSLGGLGLVLPENRRPTSTNLELELRQAHQPFARILLEVTHASPSASGKLVGGRVTASLPVPSGVSLPGMGDSIEVRDEGLCAAILKRLDGAPVPGVAYLGDGSRHVVELSAETLDADAPARLMLASSAADAEFHEGPAIIEATLFGTCFSMQGRLSAVEAHRATLEGLRIFSVGRREHGRVRLLERQATLEWRHPLDPSFWMTAPVLDLSPKGVSVLFAAGNGLLPPPSAQLLLRLGATEVPIHAEVRHSVPTENGGARVGLRIKPEVPSDVAHLTRACQSARFPMLVPRAQVTPDSVDELLRASGYLSLRDTAAPAPGWHRPDANEELTVDLIHQGATGKPVGHGSYLRVYPNTWLFHQLATVGLRRAKVAYPLYVQAAEWALALTDREAYALSYFDQAKTWHKTMLRDFGAWVGSDALSTITSLDRLEKTGAPRPPASTNRAVRVRPCAPEEHAFVAQLARAFLPPLVADGLHVFENTVNVPDLCSHHTTAGLERSRVAFVVEVDGQLEGAAICETGSRTLSLFNILNMAHVFIRRTVAPRHARAVETALLGAVLDFYGARGIDDPLVVTPEGSVGRPESVGLTVTESMGCWVASREGLKQWKNYIQFALGAFFERRRRDPRKIQSIES